MTERSMPGLGLRAFYDPGQANWGDTVSEDLRALSVIAGAHVASRTTALPVSGSAGDIYIVPSSGGLHADEIAVWDGPVGSEDWIFLAPTLGCHVLVADESANVQWTGSVWEVFAAGGVGGPTPYDIRLGFGTTPTASQVVEAILIVRNVTFPADFAGSLGSIGTNPAASLALSVQDDGVEIGTITIGNDGSGLPPSSGPV
ncbi:DUF2793 domain-containing protein [Ponticoccus sp. SC2-23]|nr:DUF2793 domain-containing protein [Ponticoccus sp. SC6-9]MBM1227290.1 DUF2793 domain-containing protein [Ponticoccus sp. SC6-15]MBM1231834.1 DUF2793 domain-containing protein [Ponticoccus sp. SC6-38]MBM1235497.1 DUF2793 domain-containing protein [Ponticoccus sp. SC6-45]MBM1240857.1 DUF2793 domain-containing protein [Ponticoccus sp. SC6-49]MBM1245392.1 DUF2793 domain-containing protein [Ponticoccus sp. SC2-64]MBM1249961.1 DUF2793 domain-containing protein [Ponticoccus sp. SC6-42]MBM1254350